jgi:uncharacterized protein
VLIAAASGRALAASARRGGYAPLVADFFGDEDTAAAAEAHIRLDHGLACGMSTDLVIAALESLAAPREPAGIVCGTGFEDRPELLADIAQRWTLFGNAPAVVARTKDPLAFVKLCHDCSVAHPDTSLAQPPDPTSWLAKRQGGAGGRHIRNAADGDRADGTFYFQRRVEGVPVSALFLADGHRAMVLGFSTQWSAPTPSQPFRYGGAAQPAVVDAETADAMTEAVERLTPMMQLRGLNSEIFSSAAATSICWRSIRGRERHWTFLSQTMNRCSRCTSRPAKGRCRRRGRATSKRGRRSSSMPAAISQLFLRSIGPTGLPIGQSSAPLSTMAILCAR